MAKQHEHRWRQSGIRFAPMPDFTKPIPGVIVEWYCPGCKIHYDHHIRFRKPKKTMGQGRYERYE